VQLGRATTVRFIFAVVFAAFFIAAPGAFANDCYAILTKLRFARYAGEKLGNNEPMILLSDGTKVPIARAFEKEGLLYSDIAEWFPSAKPEAAEKLKKRLEEELAGKQPRTLILWLGRYTAKQYRPKGLSMPPKKWAALDPRQQLEFLLSEPDFFKRISVKGREDLIYSGVLTFDDLAVTAAAPNGVEVGDDLGSYEVRSRGGQVDRTKYDGLRAIIEDGLEGKVGHQHKVHAWPEDPVKRQMIAPFYIELLDGGTWYLFWRQMKRNPSEVESILGHPYLGVYTRAALERLYAAMFEGDVAKFKNKFRMIGARNFKPDPNIPEQAANGEEKVPDFELRSGNKTDNRNFVEDMIEARIASGDYSGLRDFRDYDFDPAAPIGVYIYEWMTPGEIATLAKFERDFPPMRYSRSKLSHNHLRTKIIAPLLPWERRLNIPYKREDVLWPAQKAYAKKLLEIADQYVTRCERWTSRNPGKKIEDAPSLGEWREEAMNKIERAAYRFAAKTRLDLDFERYLTPRPAELPAIDVPITGPINVNDIALGIEYSFRFPAEVPITSAEIAEREIRRTLEAIKNEMGVGPIERIDGSGHGHTASVRYKYTDPSGQVWRAEWDGIQREYVNGTLVNPHGGHVEVPSPKFHPKNARTDIQPLFDAARSNGQFPRRTAGGGHMNTDLEPIKNLPPEKGVQAIKNLIAWFESNHTMVSFLWQHPLRKHAARAVELKPGFAERLAELPNDWDSLARFLYEEQYFNPYIGRKPRYVEMDLTGLMASAVPEKYKKGSLDIKNPTQKWFPDFGKGKDRVEFRLYDAPPNEYIAALQIKYHRALLNASFNAPQPLKLEPVYSPNATDLWRADPQAFVKAAERHLRDLGLDPAEFKGLIQDAWENQQTPPRDKPLKRYPRFLPATHGFIWTRS
jgi:hypothetical protein